MKIGALAAALRAEMLREASPFFLRESSPAEKPGLSGLDSPGERKKFGVRRKAFYTAPSRGAKAGLLYFRHQEEKFLRIFKGLRVARSGFRATPHGEGDTIVFAPQTEAFTIK